MSIEQKNLNKKISVIIAAAGSAVRLNKGISKQFLLLDGKPLLVYSLEKFTNIAEVVEIVVVSNDVEKTERLIIDSGLDVNKKISVIEGGSTRFGSVKNGVNFLSQESDIILIHDVARPLFDWSLLNQAATIAYKEGACIYATSVVDTIKKTSLNVPFLISETVDRSNLYQAQTPQIFRKDVLLNAYKFCETNSNENLSITDESMIIELSGGKVFIVDGGKLNLKITFEEDLFIAEAILKSKKVSHIQ